MNHIVCFDVLGFQL